MWQPDMLRLARLTLSNLHAIRLSQRQIAQRTLRTSTRPRWQALYRHSAQQQRSYRQAFNYQRFEQSKSLLLKWSHHRHFYYHLGGITFAGGAFYTLNLEEVPVSHRRRFRIISYDLEAQMGMKSYEGILQQYSQAILPPNHPYSQMVQRVAQRLIPYSGLQDEKWEVNVIQSSQKNAFVLPGGKIFVFAGMFDICKTDDSLAAVIGHEIGHNVAHHSAEQLSFAPITWAVALILSLVTGTDIGIGSTILDLALTKPGSRAQESEADYIGLLMMSEACYDPNAAVEMWSTMESIAQDQTPQWISTHPSNHNRMEKIREWLPQAEQKMEANNCGMIRPHTEKFWSQAMALR